MGAPTDDEKMVSSPRGLRLKSKNSFNESVASYGPRPKMSTYSACGPISIDN